MEHEMTLTPERLGMLALSHRQHTPSRRCFRCDEVWPCDTTRLLGMLAHRERDRDLCEKHSRRDNADIQQIAAQRDKALAEVERLTASHEHVDGLLAASGHPEDRIRFARMHIEPTLKGISRPLALAITERDVARAEVARLRAVIAAVEALVDEWDAYDAEGYAAGDGPSAYARVEEIRALLAEAVAAPRWSYRGHIEPGLEQEPGLGLTPQPDAAE